MKNHTTHNDNEKLSHWKLLYLPRRRETPITNLSDKLILAQTRYVDSTPTSEVLGHCPLHSPTLPWLPKGHGHGHEWSTPLPFFPCQSVLPLLKYGYFKFWPWNFKVKIMGMVKGQDQPNIYWFASFSFHINQITIPEIQLFRNLTLTNPRSRSLVRSKVKAT